MMTSGGRVFRKPAAMTAATYDSACENPDGTNTEVEAKAVPE